jgi:deoxyribose-phosphate aldolase
MTNTYADKAREILAALRAGATEDDLELHIIDLANQAHLQGREEMRELAAEKAHTRALIANAKRRTNENNRAVMKACTELRDAIRSIPEKG